MRRWETLTALAGVVAACYGATHLPGHGLATLVAIALLAVVGLSRLFQARQATKR